MKVVKKLIVPAQGPKPGYDFTRWEDEAGNEVAASTRVNDYTADGSLEMKVRPSWTARQYNITYVPGTGVNLDVSMFPAVSEVPNAEVPGGYTVPVNVTYDEPMGTMPNVSKTGYVWNGWKLTSGPAENTFVTSATVVSVDNIVIENAEDTQE